MFCKLGGKLLFSSIQNIDLKINLSILLLTLFKKMIDVYVLAGHFLILKGCFLKDDAGNCQCSGVIANLNLSDDNWF